MDNHNYKVSVTWMNDRVGWAEAPEVHERAMFSAPPEFGGQAGLWSPELFLVAATGSCFLSTFVALAEHSKMALVGFTAEAEGALERVPGQGYRFTGILLRPVVTVEKEEDVARAHQLLEKAEKHCIVRNALTVPVQIDARVEVVLPAPMS
jgi:peroxiredoxin-like protein